MSLHTPPVLPLALMEVCQVENNSYSCGFYMHRTTLKNEWTNYFDLVKNLKKYIKEET